MAQFIELNDEDFEGTSDLPTESEQDNSVENELNIEIPDKYRGKSVKDIVKMHQEAEKLIGKQAQEVGEVRRLADELIKKQLSNTPQVKETELDIDDSEFFANPKDAISKAVSSHPTVRQAAEAAARLTQMQAQQAILAAHPDFVEVVQDSDFQEWVMKSKVRTQLFRQADSYDVDAAEELLSTYKELKAAKTNTASKEITDKRSTALKAANTGSNVATTGEKSKKVYRRADIIRLMNTDPQRYAALQDDIMQAYSDGRVR